MFSQGAKTLKNVLPEFFLSHSVRFSADMVNFHCNKFNKHLAFLGQVPLMGGLLGVNQLRASTLGCVGILFHHAENINSWDSVSQQQN